MNSRRRVNSTVRRLFIWNRLVSETLEEIHASMTREHINAIGFCVAGAILLATNKPLGEGCRQFQIMAFNRDYGILSFRVPIIVIGSLLLVLGVGFFFF